MSGYINLHRDIQKHWIYKEDRVFSKFEAWTDILMRVNHTEAKVMHNGTLETVQRGSTIWSLGDMEARWKWSNRKVKRFLDCLVDDQMLAYKSTTKKTYLTVENYDFYQSPQGKKAPQTHQEDTTEAFQKHTNNNEKNVKNDKKDIKYSLEFESFFDSYPKQVGKPAAFNNYKKLRKDDKYSAEYLMACAMNYQSYCIANATEHQFIKMPNNFLNAKDKYFTQFETPVLVHSRSKSTVARTGQAARQEPNYVMREFTAEELEALPRG